MQDYLQGSREHARAANGAVTAFGRPTSMTFEKNSLNSFNGYFFIFASDLHVSYMHEKRITCIHNMSRRLCQKVDEYDFDRCDQNKTALKCAKMPKKILQTGSRVLKK